MVVGCKSYCPNPFWLSLAQRRARAISDPCSLTPTLAQPSHNPVSVPFFRSCLWLCVHSCSLVGTWLRESQSTHTHIKPNKVHMRHCPWQSDLTLQSALPRHRRPHTLSIDCKVACTFSPPLPAAARPTAERPSKADPAGPAVLPNRHPTNPSGPAPVSAPPSPPAAAAPAVPLPWSSSNNTGGSRQISGQPSHRKPSREDLQR